MYEIREIQNPENGQKKRFYNIPEAAAYLHLSVTSFRQHVLSRADFPAIRLTPRRTVIPADKLDQWLEKQVS